MQEQEHLNYPRIENSVRGFKVRLSQGAYLPGIFLTELHADRAMAAYLGRRDSRKSKSKKD